MDYCDQILYFGTNKYDYSRLFGIRTNSSLNDDGSKTSNISSNEVAILLTILFVFIVMIIIIVKFFVL